MTALEALAALEAAAATVEGVRVYAIGETVSPPGVVVGPPGLAPLASCPQFMAATFSLTVVVAMGDGRRVLESLLGLVTDLADAVEGTTKAALVRADPGTYSSGGSELPAYLLTVEFPL